MHPFDITVIDAVSVHGTQMSGGTRHDRLVSIDPVADLGKGGTGIHKGRCGIKRPFQCIGFLATIHR